MRLTSFAVGTVVSMATAITPVAGLMFNVTALGGRHGRSTIECWQLDNPFDISEDAGTAGTAVASLGNVGEVSYVVVPPAYDGGLHVAPRNQWVGFISGLAHFTLPGSNEEAFVQGGEFGLVFAADTADVSRRGHFTRYPGTVETVAFQMPTADGGVPEHSILHQGACTAAELGGAKGLDTGANATMAVV